MSDRPDRFAPLGRPTLEDCKRLRQGIVFDASVLMEWDQGRARRDALWSMIELVPRSLRHVATIGEYELLAGTGEKLPLRTQRLKRVRNAFMPIQLSKHADEVFRGYMKVRYVPEKVLADWLVAALAQAADMAVATLNERHFEPLVPLGLSLVRGLTRDRRPKG